ncbi:MAG TPA: wax ester/triacylglycerol synthase family O-acyltransferase [Thermoleophilaceae bacterium]
MSQRLSSLDATFLELEDADEAAHMHIGAVMVFEARAKGPPALDQLQAEIERRICLLPRYRSRLTEPHVGALRRPAWEPDPAFAIEEHVRRAALPAPGGELELMNWCAEFWSARLDRSRPLWETVLLEGLEGARWALATKTHHAIVDGVGAADAGQLLLDVSRTGSRRRSSGQPVDADDAERDGVAEHLGDLVRGGVRLVSHPARLLGEAKTAAELMIREELVPAPPSSLNVPIGPHRRYAVARARLADLKAIKNALGGTVNDVVLTAAAGGLRRLLAKRGDELPEHGLRAMVPVNLRGADDGTQLGNRVSSLFVHLPVCEPDPVRRYRVTAGETAELKSGAMARGGAELIALSGLTPPLLHSVLARATAGARLFNLTITNVPGPTRPLYAFGAKLEEVLPLVPLAADHAVGIAVVSYNGEVFFGLSGDARALPDLDVLRGGIEESMAELRALARRAGRTGHGAAVPR